MVGVVEFVARVFSGEKVTVPKRVREVLAVADEILAGRVAMYLIRIARAEAYESAMGVTDKSVLWGRYIRGLDNTLRGVMRDPA